MRNKPRIRFKGFAEDWEQRKLGDVVKSYSGGTPTASNKEYYGGDIPFIRSAEINSDTTELYITQKGLDNSSAKIVEKGTILYAMYGATSGEVGISKINGAINQAILAMIPLEYNGKIIAQYLRKNKESIIGKYLQGGQGNLSANIILELPIQLPGLEESNQIANFLESFDNIITLHRRKLEKLKLAKKALLQKLFPKKGSQFPEIRFKGFTDAWEQRKLGECMNSFAYGLNAAAKEYDGMHKYIRITDIDDETHNFIQSNLTSPDIDFNMDVSDYKLNVGDIVFARTGASVGKTYLYNPNDGDLYYAGFLIRGKVKDDCDAGFIYQNTLTKDYDSFIKITSQRSGQPGVNSKEYAIFRLNIPCKDEQKKISKVLNSLDVLFTLHQRKLNRLISIKKAFLQQLFV